MMQGQGSTSSSFTDVFNFDHELNGNSLRLDQQNVVLPDASVQNGNAVMDWMGQSSSSENTQNRVSFQEFLGEEGWFHFPEAQVGNGQRSEETHSEPNMSLGNAQVTNGQSILQRSSSGFHQGSGSGFHHGSSSGFHHGSGSEFHKGSSSGFHHGSGSEFHEGSSSRFHQGSSSRFHEGSNSGFHEGSSSGFHPCNIDLNATYEGNGNDTNQDMGSGLDLQLFKPSEPNGDQNLPASDSSKALVISSGIAGYVLEENDCREGLSSDGRRLSCKRRAPEDASGQLYSGANSSSAQQAGNSEHEAFIGQGNASSSLNVSSPLTNNTNVVLSERLDTGLVIAPPTASVMHQTSSALGTIPSSVAAQAENFQRNIRLRRAANQQDFVPTGLSTWTPGNSNVQSLSQPAVFFPFDRFPSSSSAAGTVHAIPTMQPPVQVPNSLQTLQPSQSWNGVNRSRDDGSFISSAHIVNRGDSLPQEENLRNNPRNMMLPHEFERGNTARMPTNLTLANGNTNLPGNIASTSRNGSSSGAHQPSPSWFPQRNMAEQYAQRVTDIVNRSESRGQGNYCPVYSGASAASQEMEFSVRGGNARLSPIPLRSGVVVRAERQAGAHTEIPPALRSLTAAQRRNRLVSEVRNALALVRRGGSLQFEDVMVIDRTILFGVPEEPDVHVDMRLDVDNMSYEELLALEDQIGNVCTGLSEEAILAHLKQRKYQSMTVEPPVDYEPCCICQEDFADGEDLGKLDCGHDFHFNCIKQWLGQKNSCPICKMTALAMGE